MERGWQVVEGRRRYLDLVDDLSAGRYSCGHDGGISVGNEDELHLVARSTKSRTKLDYLKEAGLGSRLERVSAVVGIR